MNDALALPRTKDMTGIIIKSNHLTHISGSKVCSYSLYSHDNKGLPSSIKSLECILVIHQHPGYKVSRYCATFISNFA